MSELTGTDDSEMAPPSACGCGTPIALPPFDEKAARGMSGRAVRERWPRNQGECRTCGQKWIVYASFMHYLAGDW